MLAFWHSMARRVPLRKSGQCPSGGWKWWFVAKTKRALPASMACTPLVGLHRPFQGLWIWEAYLSPRVPFGHPALRLRRPRSGAHSNEPVEQTQPRSLLLLSTKRTQARHPSEPPAWYHASFLSLPSLLFFMCFYLRISAVKCMSLFLLCVIFAICEICG